MNKLHKWLSTNWLHLLLYTIAGISLFLSIHYSLSATHGNNQYSQSVDYSTAYSKGYRDALEDAKSYMEDQYNTLATKVEESNACGVVEEFDASGFEAVTKAELAEAGLALDYFYNQIWRSICRIDEID